MKKILLPLMALFSLINSNDLAAQCKSTIYWQILDSNNRYYFVSVNTNGNTVAWDFGDSSTSNKDYEYHTFKSKGTYNVRLIISNTSKGCSDTSYVKIVANNILPCNAEFNVIADTSNPLKYTFSAIDTAEEEYEWWKPTYSYNKKKLTYTFSTSGWYDIILYVTNSKDHCVDTAYKTIYVNQCKAAFSVSLNHATKTVTITNTSNTTHYKWFFGDGKDTTSKNPVHKYAKGGTYRILLLAFDSIRKCGDSIGMSITIGCSSNFSHSIIDTTLNYSFDNPNKFNIRWDFGDGKSSTKDSSRYVYPKPGTYKLCLTVFCSSTDSSVNCSTIVASNKCRASFTVNQIGKNQIQLTNNSNGYHYYWTMGDGKGWDTTKNPTYTYSKPGKYWVTLMAFNKSYTCLDSLGYSFTVTGCSGEFSANMDSKYNSKYLFTSNDKGGYIRHRWFINWTDQKTNPLRDTLTYFFSKGNYSVCHELFDSSMKCIDTVCKNISISQACDSTFTYKVSRDSLYFGYYGNASKLKWDYGNGVIDSGSSYGSYVYSNPGTYTCCLTVYCAATSKTTKHCVTITIKDTSCRAAFTFRSDSINKSKIIFTNKSNGSGTMKSKWNLGDGDTSMSNNPTHIYKAYGNYTVCLEIYDTARMCDDSICETVIAGNRPCDSTFNYQVRGDSLYFSYSGNSTKLKWDYGNGKIDTGIISNDYVYPKPGTYNLCLTAYCASTSRTTKYCVSFTIKDTSCRAAFTFRSDSINKSKIIFTNLSSSSGTKKSKWYFGDGDSLLTKNPTHTYFKYGTYNVCLEISDTSFNCKDSVCETVYAGTPPCDTTFSTRVNGDTLYYGTNNTSKNVKWDFGDGRTSKNHSGGIVYSKPGTYNICFKIFCNTNDSLTQCVKITIKPKCQALFKVAIDTTQKFKLFLINQSSKASSNKYYWNFGDSSTSTKRNPTHKYSKLGIKYKICLTISDTAISCYSTYCDSVGLDSNGKLFKAGWDLIVIDESVIGVTKTIISDFKIYPNPASSKITIDMSNSRLPYHKIEILNTNGQVILIQEIDTGSQTVDVGLEKLTGGLYLIKLSNEQGYSYKKMMKN